MEISDVAVVGGSICGLTTALLLRDAGFEVDVYERSRGSLSGFGNGIVVQPELVVTWWNGIRSPLTTSV